MRISLSEAISYLQSGKVIAVPTETVYGLAASLTQPQAIQEIFLLKGRPMTNPLIIHVADPKQIQVYATTLPPLFSQLAKAFWPGPMTLIMPVYTHLISPVVRAELPTAGFRIPHHSLTLQLLQTVGPLVMPSANLSGKPSATRPEHVEQDFGNSFPVLDGGICTKGIESTILSYQEERWVILRLGSLTSEAFQKILGYQPKIMQASSKTQPLCPGQLFRHYAPQAKLLLGDLARLQEAPFVLGFKERYYPERKRIIHLGSLQNAEEVAENLYNVLRQLDQEGASLAWVDMDFPNQGLWVTIAERLRKAGES